MIYLKLRSFRLLPLFLLVLMGVFGCSSIDNAKNLYNKGDKIAAMESASAFLDDDDPKVRAQAVEIVGLSGSPSACDRLAPLLKDESEMVRKTAIKYLGELKCVDVSESLVEIIDGASPEIIDTIGIAVSQLGAPAAKLVVENYLKGDRLRHGNYERVVIASARVSAPYLVEGFKNRSLFENRDLINLLVSLKSAEIAGGILPEIGKLDKSEAVAEVLIKMGRRSEDPILDYLSMSHGNDVDNNVVGKLIFVLGEIKSKKSVPLVERFTEDEDMMIRQTADRALLKIRGF